MLDCDRVTLGWQVWLTPRQTRIIYDALRGYEPTAGEIEHVKELVGWFGHEAEIHKRKLDANPTGDKG